jgi:hypothetical protein
MKPQTISSFHQMTYYWVPIILYSGLIVFLSSLSHPEEHFSDPYFLGFGNDKVSHGIEYGILGILFLRAFQLGLGEARFPYPAFWAIIAATLFGISDELHQHFVPNRDMDLWDVLADFTGATLAIVSWSYIQEIRQKFESRIAH